MKTIEVTEEMYDFLINLSNELTTQDHRGTAMPYIFQIQTEETVPACDGCGQEAWLYDNHTIETEKEITEAISEYKEIPIEESEKLSQLAHKIGLQDFVGPYYGGEGIYESTLIIYGNIPPKYLSIEKE